jgi:hypothetical protein
VEELARQFDRSVTWVSRRLALVELLPEAIQEQVREGKVAAQVAMKYAGGTAQPGRLPAHGGDFRGASLRYARSRPTNAAWRRGTAAVRKTHSR